MTTAVPLIYSFPEFSGVAEAVADHVVAAQNYALFGDNNRKKSISEAGSSKNLSANSNGSQSLRNIAEQSASSINLSGNATPTSSKEQRKKKKEENRRFRIGLSGGSLIGVLREGLLSRTDVEWSKWDVYFADERLVPFDSPESNYGKAKSQIFDQIPKDRGYPRIFPIDETLLSDPQECADMYEKTLIKGFAYKDSVKLPMFDLILLGCAPDGHVASLFPNHETLRENYAWCAPVEDAPSGPPSRITLTVPVICHSNRVSFVVEGATKAPVISTIMERPDKGLPASIINEKAAGRIAWFVDDDAVSDVVSVTKKRYKFLVQSD
ncbi:hypothetical protein OGAPHI_004773 [Ogataea philodendri]|uniref:6-phosphogluconolactonase-like protein n=1 Tax=Ogataea philodendri TaxID=1378263 RepID=A0A9P8P2W6_9ASCO|nr:uncharacterized protein OGAPHI_004773 [Ogataea philodendri]KAH3664059.1 hypothetical protein OGAPHI_004773 [Ogataea philodendri]